MTDNSLFMRCRRVFMKLPFLYKPYHRLWWGTKRRLRRRRRLNAMHRRGHAFLSDLFLAAEGLDAHIFCAFGTLLGLIRQGDFIPYDEDIDIGILCDGEFPWAELEERLARVGIRKIRQFRLEGRITEQTYSRAGVEADFFLLRPEDGGKMANFYYFRDDDKDYPAGEWEVIKTLMPLPEGFEKRRIHGMNVVVPVPCEAFLAAVYGESWRVPDPDYTPDPERKRVQPGLTGHEEY